jgi:hypothetical protein
VENELCPSSETEVLIYFDERNVCKAEKRQSSSPEYVSCTYYPTVDDDDDDINEVLSTRCLRQEHVNAW